MPNITSLGTAPRFPTDEHFTVLALQEEGREVGGRMGRGEDERETEKERETGYAPLSLNILVFISWEQVLLYTNNTVTKIRRLTLRQIPPSDPGSLSNGAACLNIVLYKYPFLSGLDSNPGPNIALGCGDYSAPFGWEQLLIRSL